MSAGAAIGTHEAERAMRARLLDAPNALMTEVTDRLYDAHLRSEEACVILAVIVHIPRDKDTPWVLLTGAEWERKHVPLFEKYDDSVRAVITPRELSSATLGFFAEGYQHFAQIKGYLDAQGKESYIQEALVKCLRPATSAYRFTHPGRTWHVMTEYRFVYDAALTREAEQQRARLAREQTHWRQLAPAPSLSTSLTQTHSGVLAESEDAGAGSSASASRSSPPSRVDSSVLDAPHHHKHGAHHNRKHERGTSASGSMSSSTQTGVYVLPMGGGGARASLSGSGRKK